MDKKIGLSAFGFLALATLIMGYATWYEHLYGTARVGFYFYNSTWFTLLWILLSTMGCYYIAAKKLHKRLSIFLLHISFLLILFGALTTRLSGKTGHIHLREDNGVEFFLDDWTHSMVRLPFSLALKSFEIEYYPGTNSPFNYISIVELTDAESGERFEREISMNNILRYSGFRFYQSSFDEDLQGSILSVNRDAWGIALSYAGYYLMFLSMLLVLFDKRERFSFLLKKLAQKTMLIAILLTIPALMKANPRTIDEEIASRLGNASVYYKGRISPIQTLAHDFTLALTEKTRYKDMSDEQFLFGWLFFYDDWRHESLFELKSDELKNMLGLNSRFASHSDFFDANGRNKFEPYYRLMYGSNRTRGWLNEAVKLNDKFYLIEMLQNGSLLKIFPIQYENGAVLWRSQSDAMENVFARHFLPFLYEAIIQGNSETADIHLEGIFAFQQENAGNTLPSAIHMKVERLYNRIQVFSLLFKVCLTIGCLGLLFFIFKEKIKNVRIEKTFYIALCVVFIVTTAGLSLRWYIGGRLPAGNTYETMILLAWLSLLTGIFMRRYSFLIMVFSLLLAGFTLLVAHIGSMNPHITPLVPVLVSPLLNIHVLTIMIAYGLCGFMTFNSLAAYSVWIFGSKNTDKSAYITRMKEISELFMYPATFLMGAGIFIGAIWANQSWGRYWGWDPKEVWALIAFILMGFTFHGKSLAWFRKPLFYHFFVLIIFLSILMTYFGVNYILGGRHSYAG